MTRDIRPQPSVEQRPPEQAAAVRLPEDEGRDGLSIEVSQPAPELQTRQARHDQVRAYLSYITLGLFAAVVIFGFVGALSGDTTWENTKEFLQVVLPVITLILGGTVGYYFGRHL